MHAQIEGRVFGRLRVDRRDTEKSTPKRSYFLCVCDCGSEVSIYRSNLIAGTTQSCGCLAKEIQVSSHTVHGYSSMPEYGIWTKIRHRCRNLEHPRYADYGGRGIDMCDEWYINFAQFLSDMGPRPSPAHQIERLDNDSGYRKGNCEWATCRTQARNRRSTRLLTYEGRTQCLRDWATEFGMRRETLAYRLNQGWPMAEALHRSIR